jgi:hypothetical protein
MSALLDTSTACSAAQISRRLLLDERDGLRKPSDATQHSRRLFGKPAIEIQSFRLDGNIRPGRAHYDLDVRLGQGWAVIYGVSDHDNDPAGGLVHSDNRRCCPPEADRPRYCHAKRARQCSGHLLFVAG